MTFFVCFDLRRCRLRGRSDQKSGNGVRRSLGRTGYRPFHLPEATSLLFADAAVRSVFIGFRRPAALHPVPQRRRQHLGGTRAELQRLLQRHRQGSRHLHFISPARVYTRGAHIRPVPIRQRAAAWSSIHFLVPGQVAGCQCQNDLPPSAAIR